MMDKLNSKRIIITGGSLGIGFAIAKACAGQGAEVIIAARNQGNLEDSLKKIKSISEKNHIAYSLDVGDLKAVKVFAEWIKNDLYVKKNHRKNNIGKTFRCAIYLKLNQRSTAIDGFTSQGKTK